MKVLPSMSVTRAPDARAMKCGDPPTAANARTGECTPPGKSVFALAKSVVDLRAGFKYSGSASGRLPLEPAEDLSRFDASRLSFVEDDLTVDDNGVDADRILEGVLESGFVGDRRGFRQHEVGSLAAFN